MDNETKQLLVSTGIIIKFTKCLIVMENDSLGGREPENKTNNFGRCTLEVAPC